MIMQLLGLVDIIIGVGLVLRMYGFIFNTFILISSGYMILKGLVFFGDPMSVIELFIGVIFITSIFVAWPKYILVIAALILLQKGVFSLLSH